MKKKREGREKGGGKGNPARGRSPADRRPPSVAGAGHRKWWPEKVIFLYLFCIYIFIIFFIMMYIYRLIDSKKGENKIKIKIRVK